MIKHAEEQAGLYIHVPFCLSKCGYCSFYSVASSDDIPDFVKAVISELAFYSDIFHNFDTIYLGGGTPSLLSVDQIDRILHAIFQFFAIDSQAEITIEVNPGDVSLGYFQSLRKSGVNRLNMGIQSFDDRTLKFLGRRHSAREALKSMDAARLAGFENIGIDLIYGVFGQDMKHWQQTLKQAITLTPSHLSCYQLSIEPETPLYTQYKKKGWSLPAESEALDFFTTTSQTLTEAGYVHYEVSNFARIDSLKSRHNMKYWRHIPYLGLGPAAHSFKDYKRWSNRADVHAYIKDIFENRKPVDHSEELSSDQLALEALFLGLRTLEGINLDQYKHQYGRDLLGDKRQMIDELIKNKLVLLKDGYLCPTIAGMALADSLALI